MVITDAVITNMVITDTPSPRQPGAATRAPDHTHHAGDPPFRCFVSVRALRARKRSSYIHPVLGQLVAASVHGEVASILIQGLSTRQPS